MNYITDKVKNIQSIWKQLAILGSWLATIAGSFLLPLPDWDSSEQHTSNTRFILFIATVIIGFVMLLTYKYKDKRIWIWISIATFILLIGSYYLYNTKRETNTLPYYGATKVIGNVILPDFENKIKLCGLEKDDNELLKCVWGDATKLWTKESIYSNRKELIVYLSLCYSLLAIFIISFINAIIINTSKNEMD